MLLFLSLAILYSKINDILADRRAVVNKVTAFWRALLPLSPIFDVKIYTQNTCLYANTKKVKDLKL